MHSSDAKEERTDTPNEHNDFTHMNKKKIAHTLEDKRPRAYAVRPMCSINYDGALPFPPL